MRAFLVVLAFFVALAFIIAVGTAGLEVGPLWWVILGIALGLVAGLAVHVLATSAWRWRAGVREHYGDVQVVITRFWVSVVVSEINPKADDFDDRLHAALATARAKAAALTVAERGAR